ncbi:MAG: UDP-glucose/GDP-mannose dehydrogenase family protein [Rickettsiales bacterium]|jgi:UDPglucose 6-dehydrogenase|nr:UDP-glucose/GDP-mannose dehydrogenase family protein [Rickettsiales bacterium]
MKIAIIGTGYVGLPTGAGFAELGHDVVCIDKIPQKIDDLNNGKITLFEEGLEDLLDKNRASGRLAFTTDMSAVKDADFVIIAVGTPPHPVTKEADMRHIHAAAEELAPHLTGYTVIANKSTVPVGTGDKVGEIIRAGNPDADFDVISMPEFLREGFAVRDFFHPDRVVVGTDSARARKRAEELYDAFRERPNILFTGRRSAELIKYASNAFLAVKIHYINEIADLCGKVGANVYDVAKGMGLDSRIGNKFLNPGPGYGGSCFPKDTNALTHMASNAGVKLSLVEAAISGNDGRRLKMALRILGAVEGIESPRIAVWGLAFKDGTDDVRGSPAIQIVRELVSRGAKVTAYDPKASDTARAVLGDAIAYADSAVAAAAGADVLAVLTEWGDFSGVSLSDLRMRRKSIVDLRHIVDANAARGLGFDYKGFADE